MSAAILAQDTREMQHGVKTVLFVHPDLVPNSFLNPSSKWNLPSKVVLGFENNLKGLSSALRHVCVCVCLCLCLCLCLCVCVCV